MPDPATVLVGLVVFAAFAAAVAGGLRRRKTGRGGCSSGCDGCPAGGSCRRSDRGERDKK